jgi:putative intracellular protease/amidase/YHS domain-containing protein
MKRRELFKGAAAFGVMAAIPHSAPAHPSAAPGPVKPSASSDPLKPPVSSDPLKPPAQGSIPVAFLISDGAVIIDFCGPWEVFHDVSVPGRPNSAFDVYTVAESARPINAMGGMKIIPNYTFANAPAPRVIVIPAQGGRSEATLSWIRKASKGADVTMSVCTGAFLLAMSGLLSGRAATTHHAAYKSFAMGFPDVRVKRGTRFVDEGSVASSGGLSSGIDLALHVVERYYGREVATNTAYQMEYQGEGWMKPESNAVYAVERVSTDEHPLCPVCEMDADSATSPKSEYKGKTYYFCTPDHKKQFDAAPEKWIQQTQKSPI